LGAGLLALPIAASAQPVDGFYVSLGAGANLMNDQTFRFSPPVELGAAGTPANPGAHLRSTVGPVVQGSAGYGFGMGLRVELEGDWMNNKYNGTSIQGSNITATSGGWMQKYGVMANILYDFTMVPYVEPYIGGGVGYQWANLNNFRINGPINALSVGDSNDGSFAYQAIVGLAIPVPAAPGLAITAEYRFLGLTGAQKYDGSVGVASLGGFTPRTPVATSIRQNYNNLFLVGFRYNFGQVPPPPPPVPVAAPAPAVQPARSYLVFFDWDKATLTSRARQIIREAADASTHVQVTRIDVNGHTDTTGSAEYNKRLSIRRAEAVKAELIRNGVPANVITTQGFGFTELLVQTGPGVREPQNRRVEIILH
jgi:outer membrane protein OmpA-like peptidoglycan-associated protein